MNEDDIEKFLKRFKVLIEPADEPRDDVAYDYDVVVLLDGKKLIRCKFGTGRRVLPRDITGWDVVSSLFSDAEAYASNRVGDNELENLACFMKEFGYCDNEESIMKCIKNVFPGCKEHYDTLLKPVAEAFEDEPDQVMSDIYQFMSEETRDWIPIDWDQYLEDYE